MHVNGDTAVPCPCEWYSITRVTPPFLYEVSQCSALRAVDWWTSGCHADHTKLSQSFETNQGFCTGDVTLTSEQRGSIRSLFTAASRSARWFRVPWKKRKEKKNHSVIIVFSVMFMKTHEKATRGFIASGYPDDPLGGLTRSGIEMNGGHVKVSVTVARENSRR